VQAFLPEFRVPFPEVPWNLHAEYNRIPLKYKVIPKKSDFRGIPEIHLHGQPERKGGELGEYLV
jgi:hypothetical protein